MTASLRKTYQVRPNETGAQGSAKLVAILDYLQDAASEHAEMLGVSLTYLQKHQMTWMLARQWLRMQELPRQGTTVYVETWPAGPRQLYALREFELRNAAGEILGQACTAWLLIDLETKRPLRLDKHLPRYHCEPELRLGDAPRSLPALNTAELTKSFDVRFQDMDLNQHVNNSTYVEMALETVPMNILTEFRPVTVENCFRAEALFPDVVICATRTLSAAPNPSFLHSLSSQTTGKELARMVSVWRH